MSRLLDPVSRYHAHRVEGIEHVPVVGDRALLAPGEVVMVAPGGMWDCRVGQERAEQSVAEESPRARRTARLGPLRCARYRGAVPRPAKAPATYADVLAAPADLVAELLGGQLFLQPRPALPHAQAASTLGAQLNVRYQLGRGGPGGWWILFEPELHLGEDVLVPDLAGWRRADKAELDLSQAYAEVAPTWVCEVLSPSTQGVDRVRKLPAYVRAGTEYAWLIDPRGQTLEVLVAREGTWTIAQTHEGEAVVSAPPFEATEIPLADLWPADGGA